MFRIFATFSLTASSGLLLCTSVGLSQENIGYTGNWACSYVIQYQSVDVENWQFVRIESENILIEGDTEPTKFSAKSLEKNVFSITYENGVQEQFIVVDTWMMMKENSEQTQICLRQ